MLRNCPVSVLELQSLAISLLSSSMGEGMDTSRRREGLLLSVMVTEFRVRGALLLECLREANVTAVSDDIDALCVCLNRLLNSTL